MNTVDFLFMIVPMFLLGLLLNIAAARAEARRNAMNARLDHIEKSLRSIESKVTQ